MTSRRAARAAKVAQLVRSETPQGADYITERDAVVCARCGARLPVYAGRHLRAIHDAGFHAR